MKLTLIKILAIQFMITISIATYAQKPIEIDVDMTNVGAPIQNTMYGIFLEDINFGADGGLYAELIKNRSFEFEHPFVGWLPYGNVQIMTEKPCFDENPNYARLTHKGRVLTGVGLENEGFRGIGFEKGKTYRFSLYARNLEKEPARLRIELVSKGDTVGKNEIIITDKDWKKYTIILSPKVTDKKGAIRVNLLTQSTIDVDHISMFPTDTWKGRENGMRSDLAQALADLNPGLFRFPGGCIVEGTTLETRYQWKNTLGDPERRPININRWNYTHNRKAYDYYQSYGLGFFEYFLLSEDIGAEPLPILSCGMACQFENRDDPKAHVPVVDLKPYIDDALDLIEFANGDVKSKWGEIRAQMGHPAPFNLKYIGIGNEQWSEMFPERLGPFVKAIRAKYPDIKIVGSSGPSAGGAHFEHLWPEMKRIGVDLVDEHFYMPPSFFYDGATRYDNYDRQGPKVFAGEYAAHHPSRANNFDSALSEAAFMTGLERNADVVHMATYAPLFAHVDAWQWRPDLIWFDNLNVVKTPNYYVQQMYGQNPGSNVIPTAAEGKPLTGQQRIYATSTIDKGNNELIIKIVNSDNHEKSVIFNVNGISADLKTVAKVKTLGSELLSVENSIENPTAIAPVESTLKVNGNKIGFSVAPQSFSVIRVAL